MDIITFYCWKKSVVGQQVNDVRPNKENWFWNFSLLQHYNPCSICFETWPPSFVLL
jgi:hypothetical protein